MTSRCNNFNDFSENQLTTDFAFLCKPAWGNAAVSPFPLVFISFEGRGSPSTTPLDLYATVCYTHHRHGGQKAERTWTLE